MMFPVVKVKAPGGMQQSVREDGEQQQEKREPELAREGGRRGTRGCAGGVYIHYSIISTAEIIRLILQAAGTLYQEPLVFI
jgi:hypothetical protein